MERRFQLEIDSRKASPTDRTVAASISSEYPVKRYDGMEILSHQPGAVDLSRFPLPLCVSHDDRRLNIGLVEKPVLSDGKLRAVLRFGSRQEAEEVWRDVQSGIVRYISIGYDTDKNSIQHHDDGSYTVTRWMPYEVSLVSAPADPTVGIGRAYHNNDGATAPRKAHRMYTPTLQERLGTAMDQLETLTPADGARYYKAAAECDACLRDLGAGVSMADGWDVVKYYVNQPVGGNYRAPEMNAGDHHFTAGEDYSRIYSADKRGFGEFLVDIQRAMQPGGVRSEKLHALEQRAAGTGLTAFGSPSDGGMLVAPEHVDFIGDSIKTNDVVSRCKTYYPEGNTLTIPRLDEPSRADGSRHGGIQGRWAAELAQYQSSAAKFQTVNLTLEKLTALVYCSDEILEDFQTLGQFVSDALSKELLFKLQDAIINGIGAGMPLGIINSGALVSIDKETGQAADCLVSENILKMFARFQPSGTPGGCCWLANRNTLPQLYTLAYDIGTGGELARLYQPGQGPTGIGSMLGYPVIFIEQCPTLGDAGDLMLVDLKEYILLMKRGGPQVDVSVHLKFDYGQSAFRATLRCEGQPLWREPLTPYKGTDTVSPFVAVQARE